MTLGPSPPSIQGLGWHPMPGPYRSGVKGVHRLGCAFVTRMTLAAVSLAPLRLGGVESMVPPAGHDRWASHLHSGGSILDCPKSGSSALASQRLRCLILFFWLAGLGGLHGGVPLVLVAMGAHARGARSMPATPSSCVWGVSEVEAPAVGTHKVVEAARSIDPHLPIVLVSWMASFTRCS